MDGSSGGSASSSAASGLTFGPDTYNINTGQPTTPTSGMPSWLSPVLAVVAVVFLGVLVTKK